MKTEKVKKPLLVGLSLVLVAVAAITGTYAYLQSQTEDVVNKFTTNEVSVELTETTGEYYNIVPGTEQTKDPTVKGKATLPSYVYLEVNDVANADGKTLISYTIDSGWMPLEGYDNIYYREFQPDIENNGIFKYDVLVGNKVYYPATLTNEDMPEEEVTLTFSASIIQMEPFNNPVKAYNLANAEEVGTVDALKNALESGKSVILTDDVTIDTAFDITGDAIIDGNGKTITVNSKNNERVINLNENTEDITLTIINANLVGPTTGTYTRGISVYGNEGKVNIAVEQSEISANYYAINIASGNKEVNLDVKDSVITGWAALNIWSKTNATFTNCTLTGLNDKSYNAEGWNNFATIVINEGAKGSNLKFDKCTIIANQTTENKQYILSLRDEANVTFKGCKFIQDNIVATNEDEINISVNNEEILKNSTIEVDDLITE